MRKELENIYNDFYEGYPFFGRILYTPEKKMYVGSELGNSIIQIIKQELKQSEKFKVGNVTIRPDAKLFTLIIFHQMVAIPILSDKKSVNTENINSFIKSDINDLMNFAKEEKQNSQVKEVTAHTILSLIDKHWDSLNISKQEWWND
ncbi:hypothetical protein OO013_15710 [Mangrovivirga sp. M17]|uniref:Uncharacterized protein n=1 Tax=Mangrovivirga halotolerans TaxID=2993936 RepID=A0ABT3RU71_9BACT|nr:hypothetical protein [Mangrovivirga halotolerans]MCX2745324.1 hypothetical protein [Mangrovivirga halotolerans]